MNIEESIKNVIQQKLEDGLVEQLVEKELTKGIENALQHLFGSYGDGTKVIEKEIKAVMIPYLEKYDYSKYITKLDTVLVDILKETSLPNKKLLGNFKELMIDDKEIKRTITSSELFAKWGEFVEEEVDTDGLEVEIDDNPYYESVEGKMDFEEDNKSSWSSFSTGRLTFECLHDERMNYELLLSRFGDEFDWDIEVPDITNIKSLRNISSFQVFLMKLSQNFVKVIIDESYETNEIYPSEEPEADYN